MSYFQFHLIFNLPLLLLLFWLARTQLKRKEVLALAGICAIALAFTIPWDNYAVSEKIWEFPEDRIAGRILHLPIEEILFFAIETIAVCLLLLRLMQRKRSQE